MNKIDAFFTSFNNLQQEACEKAYRESEKSLSRGLGYNEELLAEYSAEAAEKWKGAALKELDGMKPQEYLDTVDSLEGLLEMLKRAPVICDDNLPDIYAEKLKSFGEPAVDALIRVASDMEMINDEEEMFLIPIMAIRLLGEWRTVRAVPHLINMLGVESCNYDILAEQIKSSLVLMGPGAIKEVMEAIGQKKAEGLASEYLLMALAEAGRANKSDEIFKCLKSSFQTMDNKLIGALCLKEYGDGRAVTALRGFIEKNKGKLDQETFYEVISSIKALGGSIEGL